MKDFYNCYKKVPTLQERGLERVFIAHYYNSLEGVDIIVDDTYEKKALIQKHSNPINSHLEDKLLTILVKDREGLKWGSYVEHNKDDKKYLVLTYPETTDGVTLKSKVRKTTGVCEFIFEDGCRFQYDCIDTNYLLYDDKTYTTDTKVFEEDERRAIVVPFDDTTSKLRVIDDVILDNKEYRIIKKENITEITEEGEQGVVQIVLIRTTFGEVTCNDKPLRAIVRFARMKDKILNSKSRELITDHNAVKSGDYIKHSYYRDSTGAIETRNYIVRSLVDMHLDYDITYMLNCDAEFYMWDAEKQERIMIPCYVEDNRTRFEDMDKTNIKLEDNQFQIIVQSNEFTDRLGIEFDRILLKGKAYEIVGTDNLSLENAIYVGLSSSRIDPNRDNLELGIADFYKYSNQEKPPSEEELTMIGSEEVVIGCSYEYTIETESTVSWELSKEGLCTLSSFEGKTVTLEVNNDIGIIGETVIIKALVGQKVISKEIVIMGW